LVHTQTSIDPCSDPRWGIADLSKLDGQELVQGIPNSNGTGIKHKHEDGEDYPFRTGLPAGRLLRLHNPS